MPNTHEEWWDAEAESIAENHGFGLRDFVLKVIEETEKRKVEEIRKMIEGMQHQEVLSQEDDLENGIIYRILSKLS